MKQGESRHEGVARVWSHEMKTTVSFCDLAHEGHSCNAIPIGISMVVSYTLGKFGDEIDAEIFKYTTDYIPYLEKEVPRIACFSNYIWNLNLSSEIARSIKKRSPEPVVVFGGLNYPPGSRRNRPFRRIRMRLGLAQFGHSVHRRVRSGESQVVKYRRRYHGSLPKISARRQGCTSDQAFRLFIQHSRIGRGASLMASLFDGAPPPKNPKSRTCYGERIGFTAMGEQQMTLFERLGRSH